MPERNVLPPRIMQGPDSVAHALAERARPLRAPEDLTPLLREIGRARIVMLGESSHGTREFYAWRRRITERLIERHGFSFIAVEGDWPACREIDRYVRGETGGDARTALRSFRRWPVWMWANEEIVRLAEALRRRNAPLRASERAGFHGLDVYSLFESIDAVVRRLGEADPTLAEIVRRRYACFEPFRRDERAYAKSLLRVPAGCEEEANRTLRDLLERRLGDAGNDALFDAVQNARIVANAENYYRAMIRADDGSWNVRDRHMLDTLETLLERRGPAAKAVVWAHNTHIGDYRATDMLRHGQINLGGLAREKWGEDAVALVGFGTYRGTVTASHAWDGPVERTVVPPGEPESLEAAAHAVAVALGEPAYFASFRDAEARTGALARPIGHRAIGVVYRPEYERYGNYVPTVPARRYDAFVFIDETEALASLRQPFERRDFPETWPGGF